MVYGIDNGPGTAPHLADCETVPDAQLMAEAPALLGALKAGKALAYRFRSGEYTNANRYIADLQRWERDARAAIEAAS
jgi:hypothetical protein